MMFDFARLQMEHKVWADRNFPERKPYQSLLGATEELGELAHAQLKLEQGIRGTRDEHLAEAADAVGDTIIYLADYCTSIGFDLQVVIEQTWDRVNQRDWVSNPETGQKNV